jgi:hypothetical protein
VKAGNHAGRSIFSYIMSGGSKNFFELKYALEMVTISTKKGGVYLLIIQNSKIVSNMVYTSSVYNVTFSAVFFFKNI